MGDIHAVGSKSRAPDKPGTSRWKIGLGLFTALVIGVVAGRYALRDQSGRQLARLQVQYEQAVAQGQTDLAAAQAKADLLGGQLAVEKSTRSGLEATLKKTQDNLAQTRDQLAFYDQLLPVGPKGTISVRAFEVRLQGAALSYRVLLMRNAPGDTPFSGVMQFVAKGLQRGKVVQIKLEPAQADAANAPAGKRSAAEDEFALKFDEFARSQGLLALPDGFVPQAVTLNVLEGTALRASNSANVEAAD
ncbi:MAG: hypothetical protein EPN46_04805 [Candidimonas sp.]|nr:MAG: hypothetical protein EPN77_13715 [Candidimonas sp.]TAM20929.1 MAG: hypothetical protein EPN62_15440 [Candidimonas sp.]TAM78142.1 MAG: hypothetical protein EPN46_04805 [Candidimonas sp.]